MNNSKVFVGFDSAAGLDTAVMVASSGGSYRIIGTFPPASGWGTVVSRAEWTEWTGMSADDIIDFFAEDLAKRRPA